MRVTSFYIYLLLLFSTEVFISCQSDKKEIIPPLDIRTDKQKIKDSVYYYYKLYSLWSDTHIPIHIPPSVFTDQFNDEQQVLSALMAFTPYDSFRQGPIDRFSYITNINPFSGDIVLKEGQNQGFGFYFQLGSLDNSHAFPIIYFVEGGSPAFHEGLQRGDRVTSIDGDSNLAIAVDCSSNGCVITDQQQYNKVLLLLNSLDTKDNTEITVSRNEKKITTNLQKTIYTIQPFTHTTIIDYPEAKIGYFSISSFEHLSDNQLVRTSIQKTFDHFQASAIDHLVIDLRYNMGGYVETAYYLANKICPPNADQKLMVRYKTNQYLSVPRAHLPSYVSFEDIYFKRDNQLDLQKVYFLVSKQTASAAELLIHVLKPYIEVIMIASEDRTFGKPIGYFEQNIMGKVALWVSSFEMLNADGRSDYWQGMLADKPHVTDYIFRDLGDKEEHMLGTAIQHIRTGNFETSSFQMRLNSKVARGNTQALEKITFFRSRIEKTALK